MNRRRVLASLATVGVSSLAGCSQGSSEETTTPESSGEVASNAFESFRGSGPLTQDRSVEGGTRIEQLPSLRGELTIYLGGGEGGLYRDLISRLEEIYPEFSPRLREAGTADLANTIISEGSATPADVFWSVDAGSLAAVTDADMTTELSSQVIGDVPDEFHPDDQWIGTAGRARAIPYNNARLSAEEIPNSVMDFPDAPALDSAVGWAPTYGAFQAFITAMRLIEGESATRRWLEEMVSAGVSSYKNEFFVSNAVADGGLSAGFANHYYALRVQASRPEAPISVTFTQDGPGALINVAGAAVLQGSQRQERAQNFIRHLLSAEAQEFFATRTFSYPMVSAIPPVGGLPSIDELNPPSVNLSELSNLQPTIELLRDVDIL